jgi:hypothetical protein
MSEPGTPAPHSDTGPSPHGDQPIDAGHVDLFLEPEAETTTPRHHPVRRIVLSGLLAAALAGTAVVGYTAWGVFSEKDATLTTPDTIGALTLDRSESGVQTADYLQTALSAEVDLDKAVGAVYTDAGGKGVLFLGGTGLIWAPEANLDVAFDMISDSEGAVTGIRTVDAGELGGTMKCGVTKSDDADLAVCGWADHGSLALAMFTNRSTDESGRLLREIRAAAQKR